MFTLIIEDRNGEIADEYSFEEGDFVIGRSLQSDIILPSENVSRSHAHLYTREGRCYIEDSGSSNGVFLNGRRVRGAQEIGRSGQIKVGDFYLHIDSTGDSVPGGAAVYCVLESANPNQSGRAYSIARPVSILGRGRDCTTTIIDPSISRVHATLWADADGVLRVEDLRSANGTFVNGKRIGTAVLQEGDRLKLGNVEVIVRQPSGAVKAPPDMAPPGARSGAPIPSPRPEDDDTRLGQRVLTAEDVGQDAIPLDEPPRAPLGAAKRRTPELAVPASAAPRATPAQPPRPSADVDGEAMPSVGFAVHDDFMQYRRRRRLVLGVGGVLLAGAVAAAVVWWPESSRPQDEGGSEVASAEGADGAEEAASDEAEGREEPARGAEAAPEAEKKPAARSEAPAAPAPKAEVAAAAKPEGAGTPKAGAADLAAAKPAAPEAEAAPPVATPVAAASAPSELDLLKQGEAAMADRKWGEARAIFEKLRDRDPLSPTWQSMLNRASLELQNEERWKTGTKQLADKQLGDALRSLRGITPQSAYYDEARAKVSELLDTRDALVEKGRKLCDGKQWSACHDVYVDAFAITPDDADLAARLADVRKKLGR